MSMRKPLAVLTLSVPFFLVACGGGGQSTETTATTMSSAPATTGAAAGAGGGSGSISGKVTFTGAEAAPEKIKTSADPMCAQMHKGGLERRTVEVKDGGVANTLVYVKNPPAGASTAHMEEVVLDQQGCMYHPSMLAVRVGEPIKIRNSDDTLHNIHPRPTKNAEFNIGQPRKGMETIKTFDKEELMIPVGCDVHPWMRSYITVLSHPYFAVTKEDGSFEIKGLPAGEYEVEANHPKLKTTTAKVTVKDGDAKLDLPFKG